MISRYFLLCVSLTSAPLFSAAEGQTPVAEKPEAGLSGKYDPTLTKELLELYEQLEKSQSWDLNEKRMADIIAAPAPRMVRQEDESKDNGSEDNKQRALIAAYEAMEQARAALGQAGMRAIWGNEPYPTSDEVRAQKGFEARREAYLMLQRNS